MFPPSRHFPRLWLSYIPNLKFEENGCLCLHQSIFHCPVSGDLTSNYSYGFVNIPEIERDWYMISGRTEQLKYTKYCHSSLPFFWRTLQLECESWKRQYLRARDKFTIVLFEFVSQPQSMTRTDPWNFATNHPFAAMFLVNTRLTASCCHILYSNTWSPNVVHIFY